MMSRHKYLVACFTFAIVTGCATNSVPAVDSYTINTSCEAEASLEKDTNFSSVLKVSKPQSTADIMSRHILYQENDFALNPYAHSKWSDTPNKMLASLFISCISKNTVFKSVLPSYSKGKSDLLLESTLLKYYHHVNSDSSSEGRMRIEFYLIDSKSGEVISTNEFISEINSKTLDVNGGVRALNEASKAVALKLTQWLSSLDDLVIK
jgi:cholesterol transport system auxiliary component